MEQYDVFISYSREDYVDEYNNVIQGNVVSKIKDALTAADIRYWIDIEGIFSGQNFVEKIVNNIDASKIFLFISSESANKSDWTSREIAYANELGKPIIPIRIDRSHYNKKVLFRIADLDFINYFINPEKGIADLIKSIKVHLASIELEEKRKKEEEEKRRELEREKKRALKKQRQQEEERYRKEQEQLVANIKDSCTTLNNKETKLELDRDSLLVKAESVDDLGVLHLYPRFSGCCISDRRPCFP